MHQIGFCANSLQFIRNRLTGCEFCCEPFGSLGPGDCCNILCSSTFCWFPFMMTCKSESIVAIVQVFAISNETNQVCFNQYIHRSSQCLLWKNTKCQIFSLHNRQKKPKKNFLFPIRIYFTECHEPWVIHRKSII